VASREKKSKANGGGEISQFTTKILLLGIVKLEDDLPGVAKEGGAGSGVV